MDRSRTSDRYMATVIVAGLVCVLVALANIRAGAIDIYLVLLAALTVGIGPRMTIQIPRFKSHISVSDIFIFLTLLVYGGEFAIILAALEATASAWRFCNRKLTVAFNAATMAVSTSTVVLTLQAFGLYSQAQLHGSVANASSFIIILSLIALTQFLVNTTLASVHDVLKNDIPLWETWKTKYVWTFFSYFIGAASAGILVQVSDLLGFGLLLATFPVIFFVFLTYRMYLQNVEMSMKQAEDAERSAKIMESQSDALRESEERFRSAFDNAPIGIGLLASTGRFLKANRALIDILGYPEEELLATDFQSITLPEDLGLTLVKVHEVVAGKITSCQMEQRYVHKTGRTVWTSWSVSAAEDSKEKQPNLIFQIQDITDKKIAEEKLQHDATHDALTGLPNRLMFMNSLDRALDRRRLVDGYKVSVLFIDLDRFKYVNDSLGHLIGDELLKEIAVRLRECLRPSDLVARLGGDEFTILVEGTFDIAEVTRISSRILKKFSIPFDLRGHVVYSSASIGILHASRNHQASEDVMRDADTAMYQAKRAGKARHEIFDEKMHSAAKEILKLETDLRRAVERNEIDVYYQPIYSLETGAIECFESLARWHHPELGNVSPTKFIPLAEEIGLVDQLCAQVLERACREIGSLESDVPYSVSVNLSCRQFTQNSLVQSIESTLAETGFLPSRLKLEITESVFFEHQDRAIVMLNQLKESGIEINIDDFGTGYSNLGYLKRLPITTLKIDRSFVSMIDTAGRNDEIVKAIINLARTLGLKVVAEGIETEVQLKVLKDHACEGGQGFYFAKPMDFADLCDFLATAPSVPLPVGDLDGVSTIGVVQ